MLPNKVLKITDFLNLLSVTTYYISYPPGRKYSLEFKFPYADNYYIFRNLSMIAYIIGIQNQNSLIFNSAYLTNVN